MAFYRGNNPFGFRPIHSLSGGNWTEKLNPYPIYASNNGSNTYTTSIGRGDLVKLSTNDAEQGIEKWEAPAYVASTDTSTVVTNQSPVLGTFQSCFYTDLKGNPQISNIWPGGTAVKAGTYITAMVLDDPSTVYEALGSTVSRDISAAFFPGNSAIATKKYGIGSNFLINDIAQAGAFENHDGSANTYYPINKNGPNTYSSISAAYIDLSQGTIDVGSLKDKADYNHKEETLPIKIIGFAQDPENLVLDSPSIAGTPTTFKTQPFLRFRCIINNHYFKAGTLGPALA